MCRDRRRNPYAGWLARAGRGSMNPAMEDIRPATRLAIAAVRRGVELARDGEGAAEITSKGGRDLVTATDMAVEDEIRRILQGASSPHQVVGEGGGGDAAAGGSP